MLQLQRQVIVLVVELLTLSISAGPGIIRLGGAPTRGGSALDGAEIDRRSSCWRKDRSRLWRSAQAARLVRSWAACATCLTCLAPLQSVASGTKALASAFKLQAMPPVQATPGCEGVPLVEKPLLWSQKTLFYLAIRDASLGKKRQVCCSLLTALTALLIQHAADTYL